MGILEAISVHFATRAIQNSLAEDYVDVDLAPVQYMPEGRTNGVKHSSHFKANFTAVSRETSERVEGDIAYVNNRREKMFVMNAHLAAPK